MALSECKNVIAENGKELMKHGTVAFPIACYDDDLGKEEVSWHWHDELEAAVIMRGEAVIAAGNKKYTIHEGEGFFINTGILHGAWDGNLSGCRFHSLVFHPRLVGGSIDSVFYQNYMLPLLKNQSLESIHFQNTQKWHKEAMEAIETAWSRCADEPAGHEFEVRTALSSLVYQLWSHMSVTPKRINGKVTRDGERIKQMLQYIHDNYSSEINMRMIAGSAMISESECLRCFRGTIGTTPIQYVKHYRIQEAAKRLTDSPDKVQDIAAACGFQDMSYFTKTFKEIKGCVPTEYRQLNIGV